MRTHRPTHRLLLFSVLLVSVAGAQQQRVAASPARDLVLHVDLSARTLPPGAPLLAGIQMRNVSDHEIAINDNVAAPGLHGFRVEVTTLNGEPVPMSRWGHGASGDYRTASVTLLPGEDDMAVIDVTRAFELTQPGNYVIRIAHDQTRSIPIVFSVVDGARPDARKAAVPDPQRDAAEAEYAALAASAPLQVTGSASSATVTLSGPLRVDFTLNNRSGQPVRFGYGSWVRLEVEHPDGRTVQVFGRPGDRDWNQFLSLSSIAPHGSAAFTTLVNERFVFPAAGHYVLRFWLPRATGAYVLPVTVTERAAAALDAPATR